MITAAASKKIDAEATATIHLFTGDLRPVPVPGEGDRGVGAAQNPGRQREWDGSVA